MKTNRWAKWQFKNGNFAKNRIVVPPMASQTASLSGQVNLETREHYKNLATSGAGIVFVEYSYVHLSGKSEPHQLSANAEGLSGIVGEIHKYQALAGIQLVHAGGKTSSSLTGTPLLGAGNLAVPVKGQTLESPIPMRQNEVSRMLEWYLSAAENCYQSGFDIVELHAAHGYGLNQWLSPITNNRRDIYGQNRTKLLLDIAKGIKSLWPKKLLSVRMPARDHFPQGLAVSQTQDLARSLQDCGVDLIDVSSGIGGWRRPRGINGEGYLVEDAAMIKSAIDTPVIGVGGIQSGVFIDKILQEKKVDFAAVGRAILQNPKNWGATHMEPYIEEAVQCS